MSVATRAVSNRTQANQQRTTQTNQVMKCCKAWQLAGVGELSINNQNATAARGSRRYRHQTRTRTKNGRAVQREPARACRGQRTNCAVIAAGMYVSGKPVAEPRLPSGAWLAKPIRAVRAEEAGRLFGGRRTASRRHKPGCFGRTKVQG